MTTVAAKTDVMGEQATLSLCMIVKNEEHFLRRCLASVASYVDEIIVVDTGSTDRSKAIAGEFTDKIYDHEWDDDFSHARNSALNKATGDWILVLDADELIAESDLQSIRKTISDTRYDAFFLIQYNYNNDPLISNWLPVKEKSKYSGDYLGYWRNRIGRLFRNRAEIRYQGRVHEVIDAALKGLKSTTLEIPIHHHMDDDPSKPKKERQLNYLRIIEKELARRPDGRLSASAGAVCMYHAHDYARAIEYFREANRLGFDTDTNLENLAEAHYRLNQWNEAYDIYSRLFQSGYSSLSLYNNFANLLVKRGNFSRAAELLGLALSLDGLAEEIVSRMQHNIRYLESQVNTSWE